MANRGIPGSWGAGNPVNTGKPGGRSPEPASRWGIPLIFLAVILALWLGFRLKPDMRAFLGDVPLVFTSATPTLTIGAVSKATPALSTPATGAAGQTPPAAATPRVIVPTLLQSTEERAVALLEQSRLTAEVEQAFNDSVAPGLVVSQSPAANSEVNEGTVVTIRISKGPENPVMPEVVGITVDNARAQLELLGVDVEEIEQWSETVAAGIVMGQEPPPETLVESGSTVRLIVSKGVDRVQVPDVRNQLFAFAQQNLAASGLRGIEGIKLTNDTGACGTVASQDPQPGIEVERNHEVKLNIRGGSGCTTN